jgi:hypothetical protein
MAWMSNRIDALLEQGRVGALAHAAPASGISVSRAAE